MLLNTRGSDRMVRLSGLRGSLRTASLNRCSLRAAASSFPPGHEMKVLEWPDVPSSDTDLLQRGWPKALAQLRDAIYESDSLVIDTPKYNFSVRTHVQETST